MKLYTITEVAKKTGISKATIQRRIKEGRLHTDGKKRPRRIPETELAKLALRRAPNKSKRKKVKLPVRAKPTKSQVKRFALQERKTIQLPADTVALLQKAATGKALLVEDVIEQLVDHYLKGR